MSNNRPEIPSRIKREVRKRCGFGCVICGDVFIHYDHIIDYSQVLTHTSNNITLLCGSHHDQKTKGLIPLEVISKQNEHPFALKPDGGRKGLLYFGENLPSLLIGSNYFGDPRSVGPTIPLVIDNHVPFSARLEEGQVLFNFIAHDEDGNEIMEIIDNEIVHMDGDCDIEIKGSTFKLRRRLREILLELNINHKNNLIIVNNAHFRFHNKEVLVTKDAIMANDRNAKFRNNRWDVPVGIGIDSPLYKAALNYSSVFEM